ncbi:MAG: hypothetical protein U5K54_05050 [Cytophagales bacterium]|nr:hypothetical protein [Cytophagales bacterium]
MTDEDTALCRYARELTMQPELSTVHKTNALREAGLDDRAILDATLVISYFNFVNRLVLALGLEINETEISGYKY